MTNYSQSRTQSLVLQLLGKPLRSIPAAGLIRRRYIVDLEKHDKSISLVGESDPSTLVNGRARFTRIFPFVQFLTASHPCYSWRPVYTSCRLARDSPLGQHECGDKSSLPVHQIIPNHSCSLLLMTRLPRLSSLLLHYYCTQTELMLAVMAVLRVRAPFLVDHRIVVLHPAVSIAVRRDIETWSSPLVSLLDFLELLTVVPKSSRVDGIHLGPMTSCFVGKCYVFVK